MDFGIPLELSRTVVEIRGRDRVSTVVVARVDARSPRSPARSGGPLRHPSSLGRAHPGERALQEGRDRPVALTGGAVVDETLMTSVAGIFSCGNVLHIHDVADWASFEGFAAGERAAEFARGGAGGRGERSASQPGRTSATACPRP